MEPNKVPLEYCHRWIYCATKLGERHYTLFLICGLIMYFSLFILFSIPYVGSIAALMMAFVYILGTLRLADKIIYEKASGSVDEFLRYVFDTSYLTQFRNHFIALALIGIVTLTVSSLKMIPFTLIALIISSFLAQLVIFSAFMVLKKSSINEKAAAEKVFGGLTLNIGTWIILQLLLGLFMAFSIVLCLAPFLLYFVPMTFSVLYLIYASIFENLNIEELITEWSTKPMIETHSLPPDAP